MVLGIKRTRGRSGRPTTRSALYLLGRIRGDDTLTGDRVKDEAAELELWRAAFELAVRRRFTESSSITEIAAFVRQLRTEYFGDALKEIPPIDAEALIRAALGEDIDTTTIALRARSLTYATVLHMIAHTMKISDTDVNAILARAEEITRARGFNPE